MVEVTKLGNKTVVVDGKLISLFRGGSFVRQMYYGGYEDFDGANTGTWLRYISIPIITIPLEDAMYIVEIDSTYVSVYNYNGSLKAQAPIANEFWKSVRVDGNDIRVFDQSFNQLWFWLYRWDYANKLAKMVVLLPKNSSELNIAFGNQFAEPSSYNEMTKTLELFRYDPFDVLDKSFWVHIEGTSVDVSTDTYISPPTSLKLYYGTGTPWHADVQAYLPTGRILWYMEWWWKNTGTDPSTVTDPDRGGGFLRETINGTTVLSVLVFLDVIKYYIGGTEVASESGSFKDIWLHFKTIYDNGYVEIYREVAGEWVLKASGTSAYPVGCVGFAIAGYYHAEYADDLYLYTVKDVDPATFGTPKILKF